ncbi:hypothetical protein V502_05239 [Pseudogymnoascus sp. VKM F-4520 (FW-2644)]|nr:hypothetical protein V502_05239 [Pseudogymnoascus sp. VKM F-4520 (FW-2644)]
MKFSVITLACLASFAATAYSHPGTNVLEQRDDETFRSSLETAWRDLQHVRLVVEIYDGGPYDLPEAVETAMKHLSNDRDSVRASSALSEAGAANLKVVFEDLESESFDILNDFSINKRTIEKSSKCRVTHNSAALLHFFSDELVSAIVNNTDPKAKDLIKGYAEDYLEDLKLFKIESSKEKCVDEHGLP